MPYTMEKAQACALARLLCGEKWLEQMCERVGVHATPVVGDREHHVASRGGAGMFMPEVLAEFHVAGGNCQGTAAGHSIACVDREVHQDVLHLSGIHLDHAKIRRCLNRNADALAQQWMQQFLDVPHKGVEIDETRLQQLSSAEGQ
jgi:hypothetical protein